MSDGDLPLYATVGHTDPDREDWRGINCGRARLDGMGGYVVEELYFVQWEHMQTGYASGRPIELLAAREDLRLLDDGAPC
jgi:hypothetical protein